MENKYQKFFWNPLNLISSMYQNAYIDCTRFIVNQVTSWSSKLFRIVRIVRILPDVTLILREALTNTRKAPILVKWLLNRGYAVFNF